MKLKPLSATIILFFLLLIGLSNKAERDRKSDDNLYVFHLKGKTIKCNYHDSRDQKSEIMYIDALTKMQRYVLIEKVDSVSILAENFWTCGPKGSSIKYVDCRARKVKHNLIFKQKSLNNGISSTKRP